MHLICHIQLDQNFLVSQLMNDCTSKFGTQRVPMFAENQIISLPVPALSAVHRHRFPVNRHLTTCETVEFAIVMMSFRIKINDRMIVVLIKIES